MWTLNEKETVMKKTEQKRFVKELIANVQKDLLSMLPRVPEDWDGHELRQLIADRFAEASFTLKENKSRYKAYRNARMTQNI